ncbi:MAG TPA: outer membrane beta-barrel protein, partial [Beijerinckiaceae bacterium]
MPHGILLRRLRSDAPHEGAPRGGRVPRSLAPAILALVVCGASPVCAQTALQPATAEERLRLSTSTAPAPSVLETPSYVWRQPAVTQGYSNYGKPKKPGDKKANYAGRRKQPTKPLPQLTAYPTAPRAAATADPAAAPAPNYAATPRPPVPRRPRVEEAPFEPVGVRLGGLRLRPYVEVDGGYDSNPNRTPVAKGSAVIFTEAGLTAQSDWTRHAFDMTLRGAYSAFTSNPDANRPEGALAAKLRIDVLRDTRAEFELRGAITTQRPGTPGLPGNVEGRPMVTSFGASAGGVQTLGRTELGLSALVDRVVYEDGRLNGGGSANLSRDNYTSYGARSRA